MDDLSLSWPPHKNADKEPVTVVFRRWLEKTHKGSVIALFPFLPANIERTECTSYMHIGQHGSADYQHVIDHSEPCDPCVTDCAALYLELSDLGYAMVVLSHEEIRL